MNIEHLKELSTDFWDKTFQNTECDFKNLAKKDWSVLVRNLKDENVKKVLDFGCGGGHWSIILSRAGFRVTSYDISKVAISKLNNWAQEEDLIIKTTNDLSDINVTYDCVICNSVIDHLIPRDATKTLSFFKKNLKNNGIAYLSFDGKETEDIQNYQIVEDNLRYYVSGDQKGMIWRYYSDDDIKNLCNEFVIESFFTTKSGRRQIWLRN